MDIDRMQKHEIDRWENEGGSCLYCTADIVKSIDFQQRPGLLTNSSVTQREWKMKSNAPSEIRTLSIFGVRSWPTAKRTGLSTSTTNVEKTIAPKNAM